MSSRSGSFWVSAFGLLLVLLGCSSRPQLPKPLLPLTPTPDASFRAKSPGLVTTSPVVLPEVRAAVLENGLQVWAVRRSSSEAVAVNYVSRAGGMLPSCASAEVVHLTTRAVATGGLTWVEGQEIEPPNINGSSVHFDAGLNHVQLSLATVLDSFELALQVVARTVRYPLLKDADFDWLRVEELTALQDRADVLLRLSAQSALGQPLATRLVPMDASNIKQATSAQLRECYRELFAPQASAVVVVGDIAFESVVKAVNQQFGLWNAQQLPPTRKATPAGSWVSSPTVDVVFRRPTKQAEILLLQPAPGLADLEAEMPFQVLAHIIAGSLVSRSNVNLRHGSALTYGVQPMLLRAKKTGIFGLKTAVESYRSGEAVRGLLNVMRALRQEPITELELVRAKARLRASIIRNTASNQELASSLVQLYSTGRDAESLAQLLAAIDRVSAKQVTEAAYRFLQPDAAHVTVYGPRNAVRNLQFVGEQTAHRIFIDE